jgi:hypothetical protein
MATVGEAVMRMDLADLLAMMSRNRARGGPGMVYHRPGGSIGRVAPESGTETTR